MSNRKWWRLHRMMVIFYNIFYPIISKYLGVEPTKNTADVAILKGIPCITEFFGVKLANALLQKGINADLLIGNNVLAHVPDINDFVLAA
jgi:hypothetical protein